MEASISFFIAHPVWGIFIILAIAVLITVYLPMPPLAKLIAIVVLSIIAGGLSWALFGVNHLPQSPTPLKLSSQVERNSENGAQVAANSPSGKSG